MNDPRKRTTINLSLIGDRLERLRTDSAWKELKLSNKALVLLKEYIEIQEKLSQANLEEAIHNFHSDASWKSLTFSEKIFHIIKEHLSLFKKEEPENLGEAITSFLDNLASSNQRLNDTDCIGEAREAGIPQELALKLRDRLFDRAND